MARQIEQTGKTISEAVETAVKKLGVELSDVEYKVLSEGSRGFLGLGAKPAKVLVTVTGEDEAEEILEEVKIEEVAEEVKEPRKFFKKETTVVEKATEEVTEVVVEEFSFDQKRILLAEDNDINAEICLSVLNAKGAFVERVENGQVAVETFKKHAKNYYDLILMDIQMPEMNSLNREDSQSIPIFALSADAYVENKRYSKKMGMNGHFSKPIDFDEMEKELGQFFSRRDIDEKNI